MIESESKPQPPNTAGRYALIIVFAAVGFGFAVFITSQLPIHEDRTMWLAYPAVFTVAAVSITLIFRQFVKQR